MSKLISIVERYGRDVSSRDRARMLREEVEACAYSSPPVIIDFAGVASVSDSFSDELVAVLVEKRGTGWFRDHVKVVGLGEMERSSLLSVVRRRLEGS